VRLGESTQVRRLLPTLGRRMVGAWCFVDHYGPDDIANQPGMQVPPHPHTGLQTVSWLLEGNVLHRDSLGTEQLLRPGELGLMTAGRAIAHSEESPVPHPDLLHGAQLWVALPDGQRHRAPSFEHHPNLPQLTDQGLRATVLLGELGGARSPGSTHTPLLGADLALTAGADVLVPLEPDFEHAVLTAGGEAEVDGVPVPAGSMIYLGCGRRDLRVRAATDTRALLLGGEPFEERIVMWWNFVARTGDEVAAYRAAWMSAAGFAGTGFADTGQAADLDFGSVRGYRGAPLAAPTLPASPLKPRGRTR
jgi:redox-sensitive bicupin YhaK (pirin superfamily)